MYIQMMVFRDSMIEGDSDDVAVAVGVSVGGPVDTSDVDEGEQVEDEQHDVSDVDMVQRHALSDGTMVAVDGIDHNVVVMAMLALVVMIG